MNQFVGYSGRSSCEALRVGCRRGRLPGSFPRWLRLLLERKEKVGARVLYVEGGIWDFYFDLFVQRLVDVRRTPAYDRLRRADCHEDVHLGLGTAQRPRTWSRSATPSRAHPAFR